METLQRTMPGLLVGNISGAEIRVTDNLVSVRGLASQIQAALRSALDDDTWSCVEADGRLTISRPAGNHWPYAFAQGFCWLFSVATSSGYAPGAPFTTPGTASFSFVHGVRVSPPTRAWTRTVSADPAGRYAAVVLDSQTYFDLRLWLKPAELPMLATLMQRPVVLLGTNAARWSELNTSGYLVLRCSDPRGAEQIQLAGSNAALVEQSLEFVVVKARP